jgi:4-amino-4-deoxy-L-arabinose transferase-like glycosyltransferase
MKPGKDILVVISAFALFTLLLHLFTNLFAGYGIFRDELYYIACSKRLDAGYVDHPPFSIYMLWISRTLFGESVFAIRLFPAIVSGITIYFTGLLCFKLGGRIFGVLVACTSMVFAPIFIAMNSVYSMNTYDYLFWVLAYYFIVLIIQTGKNIYWYSLGIILGLGLLNKTGFLWLGAGLFIGIILYAPNLIRKKEVYFAAGIALLIFSPYIIWNFTHDFAHLEFISNATRYKYGGLTRTDFIFGQILLTNPFSLPVWLAGLYFLLFNPRGKNFRMALSIFIVTYFILLINGKSKPEYIGPAYSLLFAGGGVFIEQFFNSKKQILIKYIFPVLTAVSGFIFIPFVLPVLPVNTFIDYQKIIGIAPGNSEGKELNLLPQFYADMFGWENMAKTVSEVYSGLSPEEQRKTIIFANNYGEAGALEYYKDNFPLPPVISPHNSYWFWFDEISKDFDIVIVLGGEPADHNKSCESVELKSIIYSEFAIPYENNLPVYICRKLKRSIEEIWNESKHFI